MVKNGYCGNEGLGLAWDCIEVFQVALFIITVGFLTFVKNTDLVKLWLEAVTRCHSENKYLKPIKSNLKLNQIS